MDVVRVILSFLYCAVCVALIVFVLLQDAKEAGLSQSISGSMDTFFSRNKGRSSEEMKKRATSILAFVFIILSLVLGYLILNVN